MSRAVTLCASNNHEDIPRLPLASRTMDRITDTDMTVVCTSNSRLSPLKFGVYVKVLFGANFLLTLKFCENLRALRTACYKVRRNNGL